MQSIFLHSTTKTERFINNMSRRVINNKGKKVEVKATLCMHCKNSGENAQVCGSHNVLDVKGRVCCPKILANVCSKCGAKGHLPSRCTGAKMETSLDIFKILHHDRERRAAYEVKKDSTEKSGDKARSKSAFELLAMSDSEDDDAPPANVTIRMKPASGSPRKVTASVKTMDWSAESDDEE